MLKYKHSNIATAKMLRKNMTPWERKLWYEFLREYPVKFQRQKPIGNYIADFYCFQAKLVIELDGSQHYGKSTAVKDSIRTNAIEKQGLHVLRIPNNDIDESFYEVCEYIDRTVKAQVGHGTSE